MDGVLRGLTRLLGMAPESGQDSLCCSSTKIIQDFWFKVKRRVEEERMVLAVFVLKENQ